MSNKPITVQPTWIKLQEHHVSLENNHSLRSLFYEDVQRFSRMSLSIPGLLFDYSKQYMNSETLDLLCALAQECSLSDEILKMQRGDQINQSENRAALHMALRDPQSYTFEIDGENISTFVRDTLDQIERITNKIRKNSNITDIVNIGIGGSELGPRTACRALENFSDGPCVHFLSNIDGSAVHALLKKLKPKNTIFIISSKSFTTDETLTNARSAKEWLSQSMPEPAISNHLLAITINTKAALDFGVTPENILPMRDWIGGRFSLWGAIGLPLALAVGFKNFKEFLCGAHTMDQHFIHAPFKNNIPVLLGLIGIWNHNFCGYKSLAMLPYAEDLEFFPLYIQQIDMESNGKSVMQNGEAPSCDTSPIVFGQAGTNAQHSFMQHLHQSEQITPSDFIIVAQPEHDLKSHHTRLISNALAQSKALMDGFENLTQPYKNFPGNRPSSTIVIDRLDPYHLGMLMAVYEHKIFVQGALWGINSFDQWGVELGKDIAKSIIKHIEETAPLSEIDISTQGLIHHILKKFKAS